jgi:hypothetical protein
MRTTTMLQAGTVTPMLAGIAIKLVGAPLFRGPYYSIIKALVLFRTSCYLPHNFGPQLFYLSPLHNYFI